MKRLLLWLLISSTVAFAQPITFQKLIGGPGNEYLKGALQTLDSGYVLAGTTSSFGAGSEDFYLVKLDKEGDLLWAKTYGGSDGDFDPSFTATRDGGYAFFGSTYSFGAGHQAYLVRLDKDGNVMWSKTFGVPGTSYSGPIEPTNDGGFLVGTTNSLYSASIIRLDSLGNVLWTKTSSNSQWIKSVKQTKDGGFIAIGESVHGVSPIPDVYVLKFTGSGILSWQKKIELSLGYAVKETNDGGYVLGVNGGLIKLDSLGEVLWRKGYHLLAQTVTETNKGGYLVTGETKDFGASDAIILETDSTGALIWSKTYGTSGQDQGFVAFQTSDGGYFMAGINYSAFGPSKLYVVKADSAMQSGCFQMDVSALDTLYPQVSVAFSTVIGNAPDNSQLVTTLVGTGGTVQTLCSSVGIEEAKAPAIFRTFPNPATEVLFIETQYKASEQVSVLNVLGASLSIPAKRSGNKLELDIRTLPPGTYLLRYTAPGVSQSAKFQKQ